MKPDLFARVEDQLRCDARAARRDPPVAMQRRIHESLGAGRERRRPARLVPRLAIWAGLAAAAWIAVLAWNGSPRNARAPTAPIADIAPNAAAPRAASVLRAPPADALRSALEEPLLAEAGKLVRDSSRAARFLVARLPAPISDEIARLVSPP